MVGIGGRSSAYLYERRRNCISATANLFRQKKKRTGKKFSGGAGNGWVLSGIVSVIRSAAEPIRRGRSSNSRFREMEAPRHQPAAGQTGFGSEPLDPAELSDAGNSGSELFMHALAWGVNQGMLDRAQYLPAGGEHCWQALSSA